MAEDLSDLRYQIALANRMLTNEGVLDAFGHVSMRHPTDPGRYLLSRSRSPGVIEAGDILEFTLDSEPVVPPTVQLYRRARDPRLHLSGAARRDGGVPSPCARGDAVLHCRRAHRSRVPPRRGRRRDRAVLEPERRVRRHQPPGGEAGGGPLARARARPACRGADEQSRRDGGGTRPARTGVTLDLHVPQRRISAAGANPGQGHDAHRGRDQARRHHQRHGHGDQPDLGILDLAPRQGRRDAAARRRRSSSKARPRAASVKATRSRTTTPRRPKNKKSQKGRTR